MLTEENTEDIESFPDFDGGAWEAYREKISARHNRRGNMVMVDGHAETQKPAFAAKPQNYVPLYPR